MLAWLRRFHATAEFLPLHEPPTVVSERLQEYFRRWRARSATPLARGRERLATLLFDSREDLVVSAVRSGVAQDEAIHLAYATDLADLVLDVYPTPGDRVRIDGQVLTIDSGVGPAFAATIAGPGFTAHYDDGDPLGRFSLLDVPADISELRATDGELTVVAQMDLRRDRR
jgi:hypothetical protein